MWCTTHVGKLRRHGYKLFLRSNFLHIMIVLRSCWRIECALWVTPGCIGNRSCSEYTGVKWSSACQNHGKASNVHFVNRKTLPFTTVTVKLCGVRLVLIGGHAAQSNVYWQLPCANSVYKFATECAAERAHMYNTEKNTRQRGKHLLTSYVMDNQCKQTGNAIIHGMQ